MEGSYETLVDADIRETIANMSQGEIASELAKMESEEEEENRSEESREVASRIKELSKPSPYLTTPQKNFLFELIKAGGEPEKSSEFVSSHDCIDLEPRAIIQSQKLFSNAELKQEAEKQLKNEYLNDVISDKLPTSLIEQLYHCKSRGEAQGMISEFGKEQIAERKDQANAFILQESQAVGLTLDLKRQIAGVRADNLEDAKEQVKSLIANYTRR